MEEEKKQQQAIIPDETIQRQLLVRGLNSSYLGKEVIGKNVTTLFPNNTTYQMFAQILGLHYNQTADPITDQGLKIAIEKQYTINARLNRKQPELLDLYNAANDLMNTQEDTSSDVVDSLSSYTRSKLAQDRILKASKKAMEDDSYDLTDAVQQAMDEINTIDVTGNNAQVISVYEDFDAKREAYKELQRSVIKTGLPDLDEATSGGLARGELAMVGAKSGYGKSTILSNLSVGYARGGYNVFHISLEELASRMLLRFDKVTLGVGTGQLLTDNGSINEGFFNSVDQAYTQLNQSGKFGHLYFYRNSPQTVIIDQLKQIIVTYMRQHKVKADVVIIDYPDLLRNPQETGNISFDGGRLFQKLKDLAQSLNVVMWTATQLNRTSSGQDVMDLTAIEGSYQKINILDFACTLNRTKEEYEEGYMRLHLDKIRNRDNFTGDTLFFKFDRLSTRITQETSEEKRRHMDILTQAGMELKEERKKASGYKDKQDKYVEAKQKKAEQFNANFI